MISLLNSTKHCKNSFQSCSDSSQSRGGKTHKIILQGPHYIKPTHRSIPETPPHNIVSSCLFQVVLWSHIHTSLPFHMILTSPHLSSDSAFFLSHLIHMNDFNCYLYPIMSICSHLPPRHALSSSVSQDNQEPSR